jgi:hypothetical protein
MQARTWLFASKSQPILTSYQALAQQAKAALLQPGTGFVRNNNTKATVQNVVGDWNTTISPFISWLAARMIARS